MACKTIYVEMMSSLLDGMLAADDERRLHAHVAECADCSQFWNAMREADTMLAASARMPLAVPSDFAVRVMARIEVAPVVRPVLVHEATPVPQAIQGVSVLPPLTNAIGDYEPTPIQVPEYFQEWQKRVAAYVRGITAAGLALILGMGVVLTMLVTGTLQVGGPLAPIVQSIRTFVGAAWAWVRSLAGNISTDSLIAGGFLVALLAFAAWQIVFNYQRSTSQQWNEGMAEAGA
jgi:hypothetical protein